MKGSYCEKMKVIWEMGIKERAHDFGEHEEERAELKKNKERGDK